MGAEMFELKTRKGKANLYKTDKNTYAINLPADVSREIFNKPRKRIALYLEADSRESMVKALKHCEEIQLLLDRQDWQGLIDYEENLKPKVVKGNFTKLSLQKLWGEYIKARSEGWEVSYLEGDIKATSKLLAEFEPVYLDDGLDYLINHLLETTTIKQAKRHLKQVSACLTWGKKRRLVKDNPLPDFISTLSTKKTNDEEADICPFTREERDLIIEAFRSGKFERYRGTHTQYADYIEFLFFTGARTSEALGLKWHHIDFNKQIICLQEALVRATNGLKKGGIQKKGLKTQKRRIVPMNNRVYDLLIARKSLAPVALEDHVFPDINHHAFRSGAYKTILEKLGITYRKPYQTRHTFITIMANHPDSNLRLHQIAKICGTSTKVIEEHYLATNVDIAFMPNI